MGRAILLIVCGATLVAGGWWLDQGDSATRSRDDFQRLVDGAGERVTATATQTVTRTRTIGARRTREGTEVECPRFEFRVAQRSGSVVGDDCERDAGDLTLPQRAEVIYDPDDLSIAFLDDEATADRLGDGFRWRALALPVLGVLACVTGVWLLVLRLGPRLRRRR